MSDRQRRLSSRIAWAIAVVSTTAAVLLTIPYVTSSTSLRPDGVAPSPGGDDPVEVAEGSEPGALTPSRLNLHYDPETDQSTIHTRIEPHFTEGGERFDFIASGDGVNPQRYGPRASLMVTREGARPILSQADELIVTANARGESETIRFQRIGYDSRPIDSGTVVEEIVFSVPFEPLKIVGQADEAIIHLGPLTRYLDVDQRDELLGFVGVAYGHDSIEDVLAGQSWYVTQRKLAEVQRTRMRQELGGTE